MNCPQKNCFAEIEEDSIYCDQCGTKLYICPKCKNLTITNFCTKDGTKAIGLEDFNNIAYKSSLKNQDFQKTIVVTYENVNNNLNGIKAIEDKLLLICPSNNIELVINSGDILGKNYDQFKYSLKDFIYISGKHALFKKSNNGWFVTDLGSTNGTFVNNVKLKENIPTLIKNDDEIKIADQKFKIVIK